MKRNSGFSLVELMVAMVIGLIIILGAGQLFLTVFQTNRQVEMLSEKQAAVNFAVETLLRDIRRAQVDSINVNPDGGELSLTVPNRGDVISNCDLGDDVVKVYKLDGSELRVSQDCGDGGDFQPVVSGFEDGGLIFDDIHAEDGVLIVTFKLVPTAGVGAPDELTFHAVNRTSAVTQ